MDFMNGIVGVPLGYIMYFCYLFTGGYALSLLLFTLLTKVIMFPLSLISQKNSVKMVKMQPALEDIKQRYADNPNLLFSEQKKLYKEEKYSTFAGVLPLFLQIPLVLGLIYVVYNPLQHLIRLDESTIALVSETAARLFSKSYEGMGSQIQLIKAIQSDPVAFSALLSGDVITRIQNIQFSFLGLDLSEIPSLASVSVVIPILSAASSLLLSIFQNKYNVLQREQGFVGKWGMALFLVLFSGYFAFVVPGGIGLYWIAGNLLSIPVMLICNALYDPNKYIDYENRPQKIVLTKVEKAMAREAKSAAHRRENLDTKRFFLQKKQLVFYSESNGFYKYFSAIIDYLLEHSTLDIHYVTSDFNDHILQNTNPRIHAYYIGGTKLISFMMRMDADMVVMTMPDLEQFHIKRSLVRKDVEYIYLDHGMTSFQLMLREHALDCYDTIFCCGPNHIDEVRETEKVYQTPEKRLVKVGYPLLDQLLVNVSQLEQTENVVKQILVGPSWQPDSLLDVCLDDLLANLLRRGHKIILRPHPEYIKRFPGKINAIQKRYENELGEFFQIETDFSSNVTVYTSDIVITDWSSIAQEFSYATKKPSIFINTPMKMMNPNYQMIPCVPLDISLRDEIGISVDVDKLDTLPAIIDEMLLAPEKYCEQITQVLEKNIYHIGSSAKFAGEYVISRLAKDTEPNGAESV